jgi:hypothetical protein
MTPQEIALKISTIATHTLELVTEHPETGAHVWSLLQTILGIAAKTLEKR